MYCYKRSINLIVDQHKQQNMDQLQKHLSNFKYTPHFFFLSLSNLLQMKKQLKLLITDQHSINLKNNAYRMTNIRQQWLTHQHQDYHTKIQNGDHVPPVNSNTNLCTSNVCRTQLNSKRQAASKPIPPYFCCKFETSHFPREKPQTSNMECYINEPKLQ